MQSMPLTIDPAVFAKEAISAETQQLNAEILARLEALPDQWSVEPAVTREMRARGVGAFPLIPKSIIRPAGAARGVYLHIHGGGWVLGAVDQQDPRLLRIADNCGFAVVSVDYRLAPEHPYPQGPDDCEAAAVWLAANAQTQFGTRVLTIGGESAGAHLSVVTLLRLRDRHGMMPFAGANLVAGVFDLGLTPSARAWGTTRLILSTRDVEMFVRHFLLRGGSVEDPDISPLKARLEGLPPALFSIGTRDCLLDDSMFMAARWLAAGNAADLAIYPGGAHVFQGFATALAEASLARMDAFLNGIAAQP
eukprot:gene25834-28135_t